MMGASGDDGSEPWIETLANANVEWTPLISHSSNNLDWA